MNQDVDGPAPLRIEASLIGEQPQPQLTTVFRGQRGQWCEMLFFQHVDARSDLSIAVLPTPLPGDRFVISGNRGNECSSIRLQLHPPGNGGRNSSTDGVDPSRAIGI